jgi:hypothetical protein
MRIFSYPFKFPIYIHLPCYHETFFYSCVDAMPHYRFKAACEADVLLLRKKLSDAEFVMERAGSELEVVIIIDAPLEKIRHAMKTIPHAERMMETLSQRYLRVGSCPGDTGCAFSEN